MKRRTAEKSCQRNQSFFEFLLDFSKTVIQCCSKNLFLKLLTKKVLVSQYYVKLSQNICDENYFLHNFQSYKFLQFFVKSDSEKHLSRATCKVFLKGIPLIDACSRFSHRKMFYKKVFLFAS